MWFELVSRDAKKAQAFYGEVLGWTVQPFPMGDFTYEMIYGSCGISRPFGDDRTLCGYLRSGAHTKLRRRLDADAKSLFALYQYGRLHGGVRLRWGFLDEMLPAPWVHRDESTLHHLLKEAYTRRMALEVVVGSAPGWADPWSRVHVSRSTRDAPKRASRVKTDAGDTVDSRADRRRGSGIAIDTADRDAMLEAMRVAAEKRVEGILGQSRRRHYGHAANTRCRLHRARPKGQAAGVLRLDGQLRAAYSRRHAFKEELARAMDSFGPNSAD